MIKLWKHVRSLAFLAIVVAYGESAGSGLFATMVPICEEICAEATCDSECYENMMEFENGNNLTCLGWGTWDTDSVCCGDGVCDTSPDCEIGSCLADCPEPTTGPCNECNPTTQTGCAAGEVCAHNACCVEEGNRPPSPPLPPGCFAVICATDGDCCSGDYCLKDPGWSTGTCYPRT